MTRDDLAKDVLEKAAMMWDNYSAAGVQINPHRLLDLIERLALALRDETPVTAPIAPAMTIKQTLQEMARLHQTIADGCNEDSDYALWVIGAKIADLLAEIEEAEHVER